MSNLNYFVHIIESPSDQDLLDGDTEGRALSEALKLARIEFCYNLVTSKTTLELALYDRLIDFLEKCKYELHPILHFSGHGDSDEFCFTPGDGEECQEDNFILWEDFAELLLPIKQDYPELLVCMSSCYGGFASKMACQSDKNQIPYTYLVGNCKNVAYDDAAVGFITFYHLLLKEYKDYEVDIAFSAIMRYNLKKQKSSTRLTNESLSN